MDTRSALAVARGGQLEDRFAELYEGRHGSSVEVRGYLMRSRLEARYALWLDLMGVQWTYEPQTFHVNGLSYLPDFLTEARGHPVYIEVKPERVAWADLPNIKAKMETIWSTVPEAHLLIVTDLASKWLGKGGRWTGPRRGEEG